MERIERYTTGGYHPIRLGEVLSSPAVTDSEKHSYERKYRILHKLGHGSFSTVWLAQILAGEIVPWGGFSVSPRSKSVSGLR